MSRAVHRGGEARAGGRDDRYEATPSVNVAGRERERAGIRWLLATRRLVTLLGAAAVGKTYLARRLTVDLTAGEPGAGRYVDLRQVVTPAGLPRAILADLGQPNVSEAWAHQALVTYLRARRLLLVLDHAEHLVADCADLIGDLLRVCPGLRVLVASRQPLQLPGEITWHLEALDPPAVCSGSETEPTLDPVFEPLTAREWEIAALIARGRSNHQIADDLVLSARTVECHVQHIYRKLDVVGTAGRAAVAAFVLRRGREWPGA